MPIAAGQSAAESPSPEDEAIIDALASYNVDAHQLVDVSDLPPTTSPGSAALAVCASCFHTLLFSTGPIQYLAPGSLYYET